MRCVVEGHSSNEMRGDDESDHEESEDEETEEWQPKAGVVYRLIKGQLKVLEGGMSQYESIAEKAARKLLKMAM